MSNTSWRTASYSQNGSNCVETRSADSIEVRDTKAREAGTLSFSRSDWAAFLETVK